MNRDHIHPHERTRIISDPEPLVTYILAAIALLLMVTS